MRTLKRILIAGILALTLAALSEPLTATCAAVWGLYAAIDVNVAE